MTFPPCPPFKYSTEHVSKEAHLHYASDIMAWFNFWAESGLFIYNALLPRRNMPPRVRADKAADLFLKEDPIMGNLSAIPCTREHWEACYERCQDICLREVTNAMEAARRSKYASLYIQFHITDIWWRYGRADRFTSTRLLNLYKVNSFDLLDRHRQLLITTPVASQTLPLRTAPASDNIARSLFAHIGETFVYWDKINEDVVECEISSGGGRAGEEWFSINQTRGGKTTEDVVSAEQLQVLLSHQV